MSLSIAELTENLRQARAAYHRLQIGEAVVSVRDSDGSMVQYTMANASRLKIYIAELEAELNGRNPRARKPLVPTWG